MGAAVTVQGLRKAYGSLVAIQDISFEAATGEIFGVLGPNGSGKTTSVECVQGCGGPTAAPSRMLGLDPQTHRHELRRRIGSQLQESALLDRIKVWQALRLCASVRAGTVGAGSPVPCRRGAAGHLVAAQQPGLRPARVTRGELRRHDPGRWRRGPRGRAGPGRGPGRRW